MKTTAKCASNVKGPDSGAGAAPSLGGPSDWLAVAREVLEIEVQGLQAVAGDLDQGFVQAVETMAACTGKVAVSGIGKSGLIGRKIAATLSSTGTPAFFFHPVEGAHGDMGMLGPQDVFLAISNSGETDELNAVLPAVRSIGAVVIGMTREADSTLGSFSDVVVRIKVPREACHINLVPTASTTATLAMGDALAVCLMRKNSFGQQDFKRVHPAGALGRRLSSKVAELMHVEDIPVVRRDESMGDALRVLNQGGLGFAAVTDANGRLAGALSDGDVRRLVCRGPFDNARPVEEYMTVSPKSVGPEATVAETLDMMEASQITVLPIVDPDGLLLGLIHLHDLLGKGRLKFSGQAKD